MKLSDLLTALPEKTVHGNPAVEIEDIVFDSRSVRPGSLFLAIRGWDQDGHRFIPDAISRGAAAILAEDISSVAPSLPLVEVPNSRRALALIAAAFHGFPGRHLRVIGITGTDGKTTTTNILASILHAAGRSAGMLSTIKAEFGGHSMDTGLHTTTPNPVDVQRYLRDMVDAGVEDAVIETTSHALDQDRTLGCEFDVAVVTNVTPEHLDYHKTYGRYLSTKGRLFASLASSYRKPMVPKISILNVDDSSYGYLRQFLADRTLTYGVQSAADVTAQAIDLKADGISFHAKTPHGHLRIACPLSGLYNVYNALAAIATSIALGISSDAVIEGLANVGSLTGRWEQIPTGDDFGVIVDFAHTPHSLAQVLQLSRTRAAGRIIVVFGCAGLRDTEKRPVMGEIAGRLADITVLTAEDPRTEDVNEIMSQIAVGCRQAGRVLGKDFFQIGDRASAIDFAVAMAAAGDLILLTGKGHERSLCIGNVEHPWSERDAAVAALARRHGTRRQGVGEEKSP